MIKTSETTGKSYLAFGCFSVLVLFVTLGFIIWAFWRALHLLDPAVSTSIITVSGTIIITSITYILSKNIEKKREIENKLRESKLPIYTRFLKEMFRIFMQDKPWVEKMEEDEMGKFFHEFTESLILWGSDDLLKKWGIWRVDIQRLDDPSLSDIDKQEILFGFEKILLVIRTDLGHKNRGLKKGDLFRLWINDVDDILRQMKARPR